MFGFVIMQNFNLKQAHTNATVDIGRRLYTVSYSRYKSQIHNMEQLANDINYYFHTN